MARYTTIGVVGALLAFAAGLLGRAAWADASPAGAEPPRAVGAQEAILADGTVTDDELQAAFGSFRSCITSAGFAFANEPSRDRFGQYDYWLKDADASQAPDPAARMAAIDECNRTHFEAVQFAWSNAHRPTEAEAAEAREYTASCLRAAGVLSTGVQTSEDLHNALGFTRPGGPAPEAIACLDRTAHDLNWSGYAGS